MTTFNTSEVSAVFGSAPTFSPLLVPILPWQNAKLLSETLGDTVYASAAFATAVRILCKLGVPRSRGAIGVEVPESNPNALINGGKGLWANESEPGIGAALRGVVSSRDVVTKPDNYAQLLEVLAAQKWFGVEIQSKDENLSSDLALGAERAKAAGLHTVLSILPGALHSRNTRTIGVFDTVALHLIPPRQLHLDRLDYLPARQVVGLVIDGSSNERTNLETALESLVGLRSMLDVDATVSVGIAGSFTTGSLAAQLRNDLDIREKIWFRSAKEKIFEALDLSLALHHGKESVAAAFAADQIARASRLTSQGIG